jgi:hypothetical protein
LKYAIKAHPTRYKNVLFRSRLEARWACFFDLIEWKWEYEPIDLPGWSPDFRVEFSCGHSECPKTHVLLVEVKPYFKIKDFNGHPCLNYPYGQNFKNADLIPASASAAFGANPHVTYWEMAHGAGGGVENICEWIRGDVDALWAEAGNEVQYQVRFGL